MRRVCWFVKFFLLLGICILADRAAAAANSPILERTLDNGVHLVVISSVPPEGGKGSTNAFLFSFVPMGLLTDEPGRTQWAHFVEHMVIRTASPDGSPESNAETLGDHMRLDWSGSSAAWREGLDHQRRWLSGLPFKAEDLEPERRKVIFETDYTEKRFATHKFALAAWNQGVRHGRTNAAVRGDIANATLQELQAYRDAHLAVLPRTLVCLVGGVPAQEALDEMTSVLSGLRSNAKAVEAVSNKNDGDVEMIWDMGLRHLILTWPLPPTDSAEYPALMLGAQLLMIRFSTNTALGATLGMPLAGVDLTTPEGSYFYVSVPLRPNAEEKAARQSLLDGVSAVSEDKAPAQLINLMTSQLAASMRTVPPLAQVQKQAPQVPPALLEANIGLQWATQRWRQWSAPTNLAERVERLDAAKIQAALKKFVNGPQARTCWIRPAGDAKPR